MSKGAKFLRADLHIHSFGDYGSYDVKDEQMTPQNIVDVAIEKGLSIISITDHNEIGNSDLAIKYAEQKDILVIPGIEVTTTQGHLLLYFETSKSLRDFFGKLTISENKELTQEGIINCLNLAGTYGGFGVLAHIELTSGFEKTINRFGPQMGEILCNPNLLGLEITNKTNSILYTDDDTDDNRKKLINDRRTKLSFDSDYNLAKLMSSDSHTIGKLGTNAEGEKKLTRIKVDELNFHSFKIALLSPESRIRLEDFIPEMRPQIKSIKLHGGLLDGIDIELSPNLTCIIGSRGAGKSTLLETIREGTGNNSNSRVVNSEVWPQNISLQYMDEVGQIIEFGREKNGYCTNITDPTEGINQVEIESFGQGDTAETIQHSDTNPQVLINFLDDFIDFNSIKYQEKDIIEKLLANQSECTKIRLELLSLDETKRALNNVKSKLANLKKENAGEIVTYQNALINERQLRNKLVNNLKELIDTYRKILDGKEIFENIANLDDNEIVVGKDYLTRVKSIIDEFSIIVSSKSQELNTSLTAKVEELKIELGKWSEKEKAIQAKIDEKKVEFEAMGIPFDLGKINQISIDIIELEEKVKKLENDEKRLLELEKERKIFIASRSELKNKIYNLRYAFAITINENLKNVMEGLFINVKYDKGNYSPNFENSLKSVMEWRTSQVSRSKFIAEKLSPLEFVDVCKKKNKSLLQTIVDENGNRIFSDFDIENIFAKCLKDSVYEDFETLEFEDLPSIKVTKIYDDGTGKMIRNTKLISQLSLGQQQSIMLGILMLSKSNKPLIIDQPEDNLDSEFIFKTIVKNLRKIKEKRQVIIVTHNPNIAVLGDAELIIPLKSTNILSHVISSGSIDRVETRSICCEILEGGKSAFIQRQKIYGI